MPGMDLDYLLKELTKSQAALVHAEMLVNKLSAQLAGGPTGIEAVSETTRPNSDRLLEVIGAHIPTGIMAEDADGRICFLNDSFRRLFCLNTSAGDLLGTASETLISEIAATLDDHQFFRDKLKRISSERTTVLAEELETADGHVYLCDYLPIFENDRFNGQVWKFTDVTRNRTIEATFDAQRKFFEEILNNLPAEIVVTNADYQYLYLNQAAISDSSMRSWMIGKNNEQYCEKTGRTPEFAADRRQFFASVKDSGRRQEREEIMTGPDGATNYFLRILCPVADKNGAVDYMVGYGIDITQRKNAEEQIKLSEKRYREIFSYSQAWICTHNLEGKLLTINPAACRILGYSEKDLTGIQLDSLLPESGRDQFVSLYMPQILNEGKAEGIMKVIDRHGKNVYLLYQNYLVTEHGATPYVIGFAQNITERVHVEEALRRSEEKYRGIIDNMNLGMLEIDLDENIVFANQRFCTMSGYSLEELKGKRATELFLDGASLKRTKNQLSKGRYGLTKSYEFLVKTKLGEERWWLTSAAPVYTQGEKPGGTIGIHLDITEQKKLEEQLRLSKLESDRLARSKDIFLTNMSHEIRTPLNAIMGLAKLLGKDNLSVKQKNYLNGIESASSSLHAIINDLLDFSKIEAGKIVLEHISFSLEVIANQVVNILSHKAEEKGLNISYAIDPKIAPVLVGDPYRVNQVFMNMLSNSIKFTEKGYVNLRASLLDEAEDRQMIQVIVEDSGVGIKKEYLDKLFDKFTQEDETVVRKFGGTGLGMSITKQLMELMGGSISVASEKNKGTVITLIFPFRVGVSRVIEKKKTIKNDTHSLDGSRILLVEDNNLNRLLAFTILTDYGAFVSEAENGQEAVDLMRTHEFDIVLMDIQMPVMDGIRATEIIRNEISATIPIIALTANVIKGKEQHFTDSGMNDYILKPYTEINLVNPIAKWLLKKNTDKHTSTINLNPDRNKLETQNTTGEQPEKAPNDSTPLPETPLYDLTKLLGIARNDNNFVVKMLQLFVSETGPALEKIREAYAGDDLKTVKYYAHRMKPSVANLAINSIRQDILDIENIQVRSEEMEIKINLVDSVISQVIRSLKNEYPL